jgi:prepilin-type N-terminal cleavage/methylation domain-containing protein
MRRSNVRKSKNKGFSLIETLIIVVIVGILAAIAIPSFVGSFDRVQLNQAVVEVRGILQEAQRQAIRKSQPCGVTIVPATGEIKNYWFDPPTSTNLSDRKLCEIISEVVERNGTQLINPIPHKVRILTNMANNPIQIVFGILGTAEFSVATAVSPPPLDSSGKIVFYVSHSSIQDKKCLAISNTLGLTRAGAYTGNITNAEEITDDGICTAF